jgi:hypothetical protein
MDLCTPNSWLQCNTAVTYSVFQRRRLDVQRTQLALGNSYALSPRHRLLAPPRRPGVPSSPWVTFKTLNLLENKDVGDSNLSYAICVHLQTLERDKNKAQALLHLPFYQEHVIVQQGLLYQLLFPVSVREWMADCTLPVV